MEVKQALANKIKKIFSINYFIYIFILIVYFFVQMLIEESVKLSISPPTKINFFLYDSQEQKRKARRGSD